MNKYNRELPVTELSGDKFYVDAYNQELIDTQKQDNVIPIWNMLQLDDHLELVYDKSIRNAKESSWPDAKGDRYEYIWLRPFGFYDNIGAMMRMQEAGLSFETDLPKVDLAGVQFYLHESFSGLSQVENRWNRIDKHDFSVYDKVWGIFFDSHKKVVPFPHEIPSLKPGEPLPSYLRFIPRTEIDRKIEMAIKGHNCQQPKKPGHKIR